MIIFTLRRLLLLLVTLFFPASGLIPLGRLAVLV